MAKVALIGLEQSAASQLGRALAGDRHEVKLQSQDFLAGDVPEADIVFAGGEARQYLALLRKIRRFRPSMPFVVVVNEQQTSEWLDALEAGATDYCTAPFEARYLRWLMELVLPARRTRAA